MKLALTNTIVFTYTHLVENEDFESPKPPYNPPQQSPSSQSYEYNQPPRKRSPKKLLLLIGAVLLVLVAVNGLRMLGSKSEPSPTPTPTPAIEDFSALEPSPTPSEEPTPTPQPQADPIDSATGLDRSDLSIRIENGSGTAGVAGKASTYLKNLGYTIVSTGNASNFNYEDVTIQIKASEKAFLPLLNKDLSKEYSVGSATSDLSATSSADALVIIGK